MKKLLLLTCTTLFLVYGLASCESDSVNDSVNEESTIDENTYSTDKGQIRPIGSDLPDEDDDHI